MRKHFLSLRSVLGMRSLVSAALSLTFIIGANAASAEPAGPAESLSKQLDSIAAHFVGTWDVDLNATQEYVKRRFNDDGKAAAASPMIKQFSKASIEFLPDGMFRILSRTNADEELYKGEYALAVDKSGVVFTTHRVATIEMAVRNAFIF